MLHPNDFQKVIRDSWKSPVARWGRVPFSFAVERTAAAAGLGDFLDSLSQPECCCVCSAALRVHFVLLWHDLRLYNGWAAELLLFHFFLFFVVPQQQQWPYTIRRREPLFDLWAYIYYMCVVCISSNQWPASCCDCWARPQICAIPPAQHLFHLSSSN